MRCGYRVPLNCSPPYGNRLLQIDFGFPSGARSTAPSRQSPTIPAGRHVPTARCQICLGMLLPMYANKVRRGLVWPTRAGVGSLPLRGVILRGRPVQMAWPPVYPAVSRYEPESGLLPSRVLGAQMVCLPGNVSMVTSGDRLYCNHQAIFLHVLQVCVICSQQSTH